MSIREEVSQIVFGNIVPWQALTDIQKRTYVSTILLFAAIVSTADYKLQQSLAICNSGCTQMYPAEYCHSNAT